MSNLSDVRAELNLLWTSVAVTGNHANRRVLAKNIRTVFIIYRKERRNKNPFDAHKGHLPIRLFVLVAILLGAMLAAVPLLGGSPIQAPPVAHAQEVMCEPVANPEDLPTVEAIPRSPGADARYVINFTNGPQELLPEQDGIVFRVDPQINLPSKIDADEIDIHYTHGLKVSFGASAYSVAEDGSLDVTVTLSADPGRAITIPLTATAKDGTSASPNYGVPPSLTFQKGETSKTFIFSASGNSGETVKLGFDTLPTGVSGGTPSEATVYIKDSSSMDIEVSFEASAYSVLEGCSVEVTVILSTTQDTEITIPLTATASDGTSASQNSGVPASLTFPSGETSKTFDFNASGNNGESVVLGFGTLPNGVGAGTIDKATVSIIEAVELEYELYGSGSASSVEVKEPVGRGGPTTLTIFPKIVDGDNSIPIPASARVEVIIKEKAGLSNPIEGGAYLWEVGTTRDLNDFPPAQHPDLAVRNAFKRMEEAIDDHVEDYELSGLLIDFQVELGEHIARRGDQLELTARGFAVGTTVIFWRDSNMNGVFDALGAVLCRAESDSQAIARCSIPVTNPPFVPGFGDCTFDLSGDYVPNDSTMVGEINVDYEGSNCNFINARDGEGHTSILVLEEYTEDGTQLKKKENVENSFQVMELAGTVNLGTFLRTNSTVRVDLLDFPEGHLNSIRIGGFAADLEGLGNRQIPETGRLSFHLAMPGDVLPGRQEIRVVVEGEIGDCEEERNGDQLNGGFCLELHTTAEVDTSLHVQVTPSTALPNQRVRVTVQGFHGTEITRVSMDGVELPASRVGERADGPIQLDSSGRWVGSVVLPVNGSTLLGGERKLQVRDSHRRLGEATIVFPHRSIEVSPEQAVPGDTVTISGQGFPVSNNRGSEVQVEITYDYGSGQSTTSVSIDAGGRFSTEMTVPRAVEIPSTNLVSAEFMDDEGHTIFTNTTHLITEATVTVSPDRGPSGTTVTVTGRGFRAFTSVAMVIMGEVNVTPSPAPLTDRNGMMEFEVLVPQSETGQESIVVLAGGIYVLADFQVGTPLVETGPVTDIEALSTTLGDSFLTAFHFGNDTKEWTFHDPHVQEESTLEFLIPGEVYYIKTSENTEAILNGRTRYLSCRNDNCWNQIVW